jgi:thioredoxin-dependent peroxiredoxin
MSSKRGEIKGEARMEERTGEAFAFDEQLTVVGSKLQPGGVAPDFLLDYLDLIGMTIQSARLADSTGMVRLLNVVNSLERPVCNRVTRRWEDLSAGFPAGVCLYTVSMDLPLAQARWQAAEGIMHQLLSAQRSEQFGRDYGVLLKEWLLLQRAVFVIGRDDHIAYAEYIADQMGEPDYAAAIEAARQRACRYGA